MNQRLGKHGIIPYRFPAIDGKNIKERDYKIIGSKLCRGSRPGLVVKEPLSSIENSMNIAYGETVFHSYLSKGAAGCYLSHLFILRSAQIADYNYIWVLEDDVVFLKDPKTIGKYILELNEYIGDENWDVLYTDDFVYWAYYHYRMDLCEIFSEYLKNNTIKFEKK